jgi:hypothetical protein
VRRGGSKEEKIVKSGPHIALAVGVGYLLGRRRKLRTAVILGGAAAVGRFSGDPAKLLARGTKMLGGSADLSKVTALSGPLVKASKVAARTAVSNRIDAMSGRLQERTETLRGLGQKAPGMSRRERDRETAPDDEYEEYEEYDEEPEDEEPQGRSAAGRRRRSEQGNGHRRSGRPAEEPEYDQAEDEEPEDDEPDEAPAARGGRSRTDVAPVRRRGR